MVGSAGDYLALVGNTVIVTLGTVAFSAGISVFVGERGFATSFTIIWLLIIESMMDGDDPGSRWFYAFLPFANGLRSYQHLPAERFLWPTWTSLTYFLIVAFGLFALAVAAKRKNTTP